MSLASDYDAFNHMRRALFWEPERPIVMITMYADDAGKVHEDDYLVMSAYIGLTAQWDRFCPDWRLRLAQAGLPEFHANKFFNGAGIFAGWNKKERKLERESLLQDLAQTINAYTLHSFSFIVHVPSWNRVNEEYLLAETLFTPYVLCGHVIVQRIKEWCAHSGYDEKSVKYIFDQGSDDWGKLVKRLRIDHDITPLPGDRRELRPLQAADWFAYEEFREAPQANSGIRTRRFRESFRLLLRLPDDLLIYREAGLRTLCANPDMHIPPRTRAHRYHVSIRFDDKRVKRVGHKLKKLAEECAALIAKPANPGPTPPEIKKTYEKYERATADLERARTLEIDHADRENWGANMRLQREYMEQQVDLLQKIVTFLKKRTAGAVK